MPNQTIATLANKVHSANFADAFITYVDVLSEQRDDDTGAVMPDSTQEQLDSAIDLCIDLVKPLVGFNPQKAAGLMASLIHLKGFHGGTCTSPDTIKDIAEMFGLEIY
jgi:hypothetical protein